ncbi:IPTL-CTERM sorting domain-containing protein [Acidovorax sp. SDU_ACID1]|uniref:IPTL-CTERM sorting domain-containing protein n=1 Tax=Acidovorax sp. SDU_ACID1 TaxID=3136632 RepID=UPI0038736DB6
MGAAPGASAQLGGGTAALGCASLRSGGALQLDGGALLGARDVQLQAGALLAVGAGHVELAQQWSVDAAASVTLTTGRVERKDASPGCPAVGAVGQLLPGTAPPPAQPVVIPTPPGGGASPGTAQVTIAAVDAGGAAAALPPGCTVMQLAITHAIPPGAPANASFPLGALRFAAQGCPGATLQVNVTYPSSLAGLALQKHGPYDTGTPQPQTGWFTPPNLQVNGTTVTYTVTDGGDGDGDARAGFIADPFAPMQLLAAPGPGGPAAIPTLNEWGLLLLSALAALLGARRLRPAPRRFD